MKQLIRSEDRGHANHGWLDSYHTFSFSSYYNPEMMGFGPLRVINEDRVAPGAGFPLHPHRDMEIITYVISGALEHKDTLGSNAVIRPGEVQKMSAGTGIRHSEFNPSSQDEVHLLQIWILPDEQGIEPSYDQRSFAEKLQENSLVLVASKDGRDDTVHLRQDAEIWISKPALDETVDFPLKRDRAAWLQVVRGEIDVEGEILKAGDALAVAEDETLRWTAKSGDAELMIFDLRRTK